MRLTYHPEAEAELIESAQFYESRATALGTQFLDAVDRAIRVIQGAPERGRTIGGDVRAYLVQRFPYTICYRVHSSELRVLAIMHHSRKPGYWQTRTAE